MKKARSKEARRRSAKRLALHKGAPSTSASTTEADGDRLDIGLDELKAIVERTRAGALTEPDRQVLDAAVDTLAFVTGELEAKGTTLTKLRRLVFGPSSEKTRTVLGKLAGAEPSPEAGQADAEGDAATTPTPVETIKAPRPKGGNPKGKGHGRKAAEKYVGAERVSVPHASLHSKDCCPDCETGRVYRKPQPAVLVRVRGVGPLAATVYELDRLRCNLCGKTFTADPPEGVGDKKYDESVVALVAVLRYGCGLPNYRLERLSHNLGIPLPAGTQVTLVSAAAVHVEPVWAELIRYAAQGDLFYIDDSKMKILDLSTELQKAVEAGLKDVRTGIYTSGVIARVGEYEVVLFFTGNQHAGENLQRVLAERAAGAAVPMAMSDALASNTSGEFERLVALCLTNGRRKFVEVVKSFPAEVEHVLNLLREVYMHDASTRAAGLSAAERLLYHQEKSQPVMDELHAWLAQQLSDKRVEKTSSLGKAIKYMQTHWDGLTLFLRVAGAPLDNNLVEQALKRAIVHRKNSLFYKTENGAHVGDMFMSLIHSAELCGENPFDYLLALQLHAAEVKKAPERWLPWCWRAAVEALKPSSELAATG